MPTNSVARIHKEQIRYGDTNLESHASSGKMRTKSYTPLMFNVRCAFTTAGNYEQTIRLPNPILNYHKALPKTLDRYQGKLLELFPELSSISEEELKRIGRKREP